MYTVNIVSRARPFKDSAHWSKRSGHRVQSSSCRDALVYLVRIEVASSGFHWNWGRYEGS